MAFTPLRMVSAEVTSTTETGAGNATTTYDGFGSAGPAPAARQHPHVDHLRRRRPNHPEGRARRRERRPDDADGRGTTTTATCARPVVSGSASGPTLIWDVSRVMKPGVDPGCIACETSDVGSRRPNGRSTFLARRTVRRAEGNSQWR
jgi:hypothetical protein